MKNLLAATLILLPTLSVAQSTETILGQGRLFLSEAGVSTSVGSVTVVGSDLVIDDFSFYPKEGRRMWEIYAPKVRLVPGNGGYVLKPEEDLQVAFLPTMNFVSPLLFSLSPDNFKLSVDVDSNEISGASLTADKMMFTTEGQLAEMMGLDAAISVNNFSIADMEASGTDLRQMLTWSSSQASFKHLPPEDGPSTVFLADLGPLTLETSISQGGLLETFPWTAAIGAGMTADLGMTLGRSQISLIVSEDSEAGNSSHVLDMARIEAKVEQTRLMSSIEGKGEGLSLRITQPNGNFFVSDFASLFARLEGPLFSSPSERTATATVRAMGKTGFGDFEFPIDLNLSASVGVIPVIDWLDFNITNGDKNWRNITSAFDFRSLNVVNGSFAFGEDDYKLSGRLDEQAPSMKPGFFRVPTGTLSFVTSQTEDLMVFVGQSGFFTPMQNSTLLSIFIGLFGTDGGIAGGKSDVVFSENGITLNGEELR
jgi:hypothetical protein